MMSGLLGRRPDLRWVFAQQGGSLQRTAVHSRRSRRRVSLFTILAPWCCFFQCCGVGGVICALPSYLREAISSPAVRPVASPGGACGATFPCVLPFCGACGAANRISPNSIFIRVAVVVIEQRAPGQPYTPPPSKHLLPPARPVRAPTLQRAHIAAHVLFQQCTKSGTATEQATTRARKRSSPISVFGIPFSRHVVEERRDNGIVSPPGVCSS
eukprot:gene8254-biopygen16616